ncbi:hypothetical protein Dsin_014725 [Dipteronia sinensis]|uniref:Flap endonuclease GEN-like 2 n=1 Tax=Dipteronia sinensis TaxID=43782 RepID=A0AAE0ANF5_9ROSI|nr:hypothetical protein Dsin_014725 [Dipteronia sinensis]
MGVKNLWDILESCKKTLPLHHLQNKRVCIDLSCWIVQLQNANKSHRPAQIERLYLRGLFHRLRALIALNCSLIFVTDGSIPAIKLATYRRRLNPGSEVTQDEANSAKVPSLRRNMGSEFSCMVKDAKALGLALGVPCLDGMEEGEAQCALLNSESLCDGCFSSDSDIFLFGARTVYRDICLGEGGHVVCYEMADIERKLGFGRNSLIALALILGSDYSQGVRGLGPESACQIVKSIGDSVVLQKIAAEGLSFLKHTKRQLRKCDNKENSLNQEMNIHGIVHCPQRENQFVQVIDAYLKPKCHSADSEVVHWVLSQHLFQRAKLHQMCVQFFEWLPEKTDEYILPKIAERDLRRFANLRSTSSALGITLPIQKIPVKCPIKEIIKRRKFQGRECFEVSWEELDGLETSVVPGDLIESACPEKIVEFDEKRPQARPKKSKPKSSVAEIDPKLQALLLDIESESSTLHNATFSSRAVMLNNRTRATDDDFTRRYSLRNLESESDADVYATRRPTDARSEIVNLLSPSPVSSCTTRRPTDARSVIINLSSPSPVPSRNVSRFQQVIAMQPDPLLDSESERNADGNATLPCHLTGITVAHSETIDLLSPSPMCNRNVSRNVEMNYQHSNVLNLSDSETERSPEHEKKARDLRLFLASIRDDIP